MFSLDLFLLSKKTKGPATSEVGVLLLSSLVQKGLLVQAWISESGSYADEAEIV